VRLKASDLRYKIKNGAFAIDYRISLDDISLAGIPQDRHLSMDRIPCFNPQQLEAACRVLADTTDGLTGAQIAQILREMNVTDVSPEMTKWKRLFNALIEKQNQHQVGNHLIMFITRAMNPVSYAREKAAFEWRRDELNVVLAFVGLYLREDGKVARSSKETTLTGARARAGRMRAALESRAVHSEVLKYCRAELIEENYFHSVLEATKGMAERIRQLSELGSDGADLAKDAFNVGNPLLALNPLRTDTEKSEQAGFANLLIGVSARYVIRSPMLQRSCGRCRSKTR